MKAVLISIQPKWCELIASGKKTIEVRKSVPKLNRPFKCYIYCTIGNGVKGDYLVPSGIQCGKVIGEFVCRGVMDGGSKLLPKQSCLTLEEIWEYAKGKTVYGWRIADLKIYDKPKELSEFYRQCPEYYSSYEDGICAEACIWYEFGECKNFCLPITRPPQSWCYVEVEE